MRKFTKAISLILALTIMLCALTSLTACKGDGDNNGDGEQPAGNTVTIENMTPAEAYSHAYSKIAGASKITITSSQLINMISTTDGISEIINSEHQIKYGEDVIYLQLSAVNESDESGIDMTIYHRDLVAYTEAKINDMIVTQQRQTMERAAFIRDVLSESYTISGVLLELPQSAFSNESTPIVKEGDNRYYIELTLDSDAAKSYALNKFLVMQLGIGEFDSSMTVATDVKYKLFFNSDADITDIEMKFTGQYESAGCDYQITVSESFSDVGTTTVTVPADAENWPMG